MKLKRLRYCKGFGVHSPFAFHLITGIINEDLPYYDYTELKLKRKELLREARNRKDQALNPLQVDELLFRLINYQQPQSIRELGTGFPLSMQYMSSARKKADKELFDSSDALLACLRKAEQVDFLLFNRKAPATDVWEQVMEKTHAGSLLAITGIHSSPAMKEWWKEIVADERTGVTFDLYSLGLVFFDTKKNKQHYIVHF